MVIMLQLKIRVQCFPERCRTSGQAPINEFGLLSPITWKPFSKSFFAWRARSLGFLAPKTTAIRRTSPLLAVATR